MEICSTCGKSYGSKNSLSAHRSNYHKNLDVKSQPPLAIGINNQILPSEELQNQFYELKQKFQQIHRYIHKLPMLFEDVNTIHKDIITIKKRLNKIQVKRFSN